MTISEAPAARGLTRRNLLAGGATLIAGSALAACSPTSTPSTSTGAASSAPTSRSLPAEFVVANESEPTDLLPYASGFGTWLIDRQIYETLVEPRITIGTNGAIEIAYQPRLAVRWERPEPTRWRFSLRPNVRFHNGEPWNAEAAKKTFDVLIDRDLAASLKKTSFLGRSFVRSEVIDPLTVDFITSRPDAEALSTLRIGYVGLPAKLLEEKGLEAFRENPVGTGFYRFKSWTRGQEIRLDRNREHWNQNGPNMGAIRYIVRQEAAVRAQTIKTGEAHLAYNIGGEQAQALKNSVVGGGFQSSGIRLNNAHPVTGDIRVRRALNLAIDRRAIVQSIFRGAAVPIAFFGFQPVNLDPFAYRPDEAKTLVEQAGARGTQLELVYGEGRIPEEDQLVEIYKAAFEAIGLRITLRKLEPRQYNEIGGRPFPEQPPLYMETTSSGNYGEIASGLADKYGCSGTGTFCKPEFDQEFASLAALEGQARTVKLQQIAERLHRDETPRVWVAAVRQVHGLAEGVQASLPANAYILFDDLRFA